MYFIIEHWALIKLLTEQMHSTMWFVCFILIIIKIEKHEIKLMTSSISVLLEPNELKMQE